MSTKQAKKSRKVVRGPQLPLPLKARRVKAGTKAKGPEPERTMRIRYVEPPTKKDGNPFFALRCDAGLLRAFKAFAKKTGKPATVIVREHMAKLTGYEIEVDNAE